MRYPSTAMLGDNLVGVMAMLERYNRVEKRQRELEYNFKPGGLLCHAWPFPLVQPYETLRWQTYSRQQRRADARKAAKGSK